MRVLTVVGRSVSVTSPRRSSPRAASDSRSRRPSASLADHAEQQRLGAEGAQVGGHVARAAERVALALDLDHGHRRLGRDALDPAPQVAVDHAVAEHGDAAAGEAAHDGPEGREIDGRARTYGAGRYTGARGGSTPGGSRGGPEVEALPAPHGHGAPRPQGRVEAHGQRAAPRRLHQRRCRRCRPSTAPRSPRRSRPPARRGPPGGSQRARPAAAGRPACAAPAA